MREGGREGVKEGVREGGREGGSEGERDGWREGERENEEWIGTKLPRLPSHTAPASSECLQLWSPHPLKLHSSSEFSKPVQRTLSNHITPWPLPNSALVVARVAVL